MKNICGILGLIIVLISTSGFSQDKKIDGFSHPESVVYDEANGFLYLSNMADREPGDGFISKLTKEGEVIEPKWITGLDDPKGLLVQEGKLYVTDNKVLVEMDLNKGKVIRKITVPGAASLNDIASDDNGTLYISDMGKSSIYTFQSPNTVEEWLNDPQLSSPNGLLVNGGHILVGAWGNKESAGNVLQVDKTTKEINQVTSTGIGNLDGVQRIDDNTFYVSDWNSGKIYRISLNGEQQEVLTSEKSSGDILFLRDRNQLILPMNRQNQVWIYNLD